MSFKDGHWDDTRQEQFQEMTEMVRQIQPTLKIKIYEDGSCSEDCQFNIHPYCSLFGKNSNGRPKGCIDSQI